jgi:hypothetical protein
MPREAGASTNILVSSNVNIEAINAMPWMSGISVTIEPEKLIESGNT